MKELDAPIINIERFGTHDGPGIRTVIFFKGCALRCAWCANPESQRFEPEILFLENACVGCGACITNCPRGAVVFMPEYGYITQHDRCDFCLKCVEGCYYNARQAMGVRKTESELWAIIEKDKAYYLESDGGITFSGGEPLFHSEMIAKLATRAHEAGFTTLVETCGYIGRRHLEQINGLVDYLFYDFKHYDPEIHRQLTGQSNDLIIENLRWVDEHFKGEYSVRYPVIPHRNDADEDIDAFFAYAESLKRCNDIVFLPYHRLGTTKYNGLGRDYEMGDQEPLTQADLADLVARGRARGLNVKVG